MMLLKSIIRVTGFIVMVFALTACLGPVQERQANLYTLQVNHIKPLVSSRQQQTLLISIPTAAPGYDSSKMIYVQVPYRLDSYAYNRWVDAPANLLQPLIQNILQQTEYFHAVVAAPFAGASQLRLDSELIMLQQSYIQQPSEIQLAVQVRLVASATQQVLASRLFVVTQPVSAADPYAGVIATNQAVAEFLQQLAEFVIANA